MRFQLMGGVFAALVALLLQGNGLADLHLHTIVVGGVDPDCDHSDSMEFDCVEINQNQGDCGKHDIVNPVKQSNLDVLANSQVKCTDNNCQNATLDIAKNVCTRIGGGD